MIPEETLNKTLRRLTPAERAPVDRSARQRGWADAYAMCEDMSYWTLTLREYLAAYPDPGEPDKTAGVTCDHCGKVATKGREICGYCGAILPAE